MKGIIRRSRGLAALLLVALAAGGVALWQGSASAGEKGAPRFGAADLADAVLFNDGPAAPYLEKLNRGTVPWTETLREGQDAVHEALKKDEKRADAFAQGVQSGDPERVKASISDLSFLTHDALVDRFGRDRVDEAVYRIVKDVFGEEMYSILKSNLAIPLNLQRLSYPCCLENYVDPLVSSILVAFMQDVWQVDGIARDVSQFVQELTIGEVASQLQAG